MKLVSWNVNGLRSCLQKGFADSMRALDADVICLQETKMEPHQADIPLEGYEMVFNSAEKKGYSGTAVLTRAKPLAVSLGIGIEEHDHEGRVITLEFPDFYLVNCYTPNSQRELKRLDYRMRWEDDFQDYLARLDAQKPAVLCGVESQGMILSAVQPGEDGETLSLLTSMDPDFSGGSEVG